MSSTTPPDAFEPVPQGGRSPATLTEADVARLAHLARLELTSTELTTYVGQLGVILDAVAVVGALPLAGVEPTSHAVPLTNVFREDHVEAGLARDEALAGAPAAEDGKFRVPQILGEEQ